MYKLILVDDEAIVREGIRDNINWNELGFEVIDDCVDGREAMESIERWEPDVVLTDINMPFVDGLQLTRFILERNPNTKVIILTGYDEFAYAQKAVKLKAYDYLLKPITASELTQLLKRLKNELEEEQNKTKEFQELKMKLKESFPLLKARFLNRLISGGRSPVNFQEKLNYFDLNLRGAYFLVLVVDVDDPDQISKIHSGTEDELLLFAVFNICEKIVLKHNEGQIFQNNQEKTIIILASNDPSTLLEKAHIIGEEICGSVENFLRFTVSIGLGTLCNNLEELHFSYRSAVSALDYRFVLGNNHVIQVSEIEESMGSKILYSREAEKNLILSIKTGTESEIDEMVTKALDGLRKCYVSTANSYIQIQHLCLAIFEALAELGVDLEQMEGYENKLISEVHGIKTLEQAEKWLKEFCKQASRTVAGKRDDFWKIQAQKAEQFIKEHYMDPEISLHSISKYLSVSTSYFSLIFKNATKQTYIEYLTKIRMEKAMELLKSTDLKSYEIAERIGYEDPHYFSLLFKKVKGISPSEYRERMS